MRAFLLIILCLSVVSFAADKSYAQESYKFFTKVSERKADSLSIYSYPNPFSPSDKFYPPVYNIDVPENCFVRISLYHGDNLLRSIYEDYTTQGVYILRLNNLEFFRYYENGTYKLSVEANGRTAVVSFPLKR